MKVKTKKGLVFGIGGALIVIGCIVGGCWSLIYTSILHANLGLTPTSTSFKPWQETPIPMYMDLYMWNWTNAAEVFENNSIKPIFEEHGPYVFSELHIKVNLTWNDNATITFLQERWWQHVPDQTIGSLDDIITNIDMIAATLGNAARHASPVVKIILNYVMERLQKDVIITKTVRELLFDGYEDPLLQLASKLNLTIPVPFTRFGWFVERNGSANYDGHHNMHTGTDELALLGQLAQWKFKSTTNFYEPPCNKIYGTLGEIGPPMKGVNQINIFTSDFCTALPMYYDGEYEKLGVIGNDYVGRLDPFDYTIESRQCYCPLVNGTMDCPRNGVINVSKCKFGAPVYVSYPHFYLADEFYREGIEGMTPDKKKHEFHYVIEPITGIPLEVRGQLQINVKMEKFDGIDIYQKAPEVFIPAIWFNLRADLPEENAGDVKLLVLVPAIGMGTFFGLACIGVLMVVIGVVLTVRKGWKGDSEEGEHLVPPKFD